MCISSRHWSPCPYTRASLICAPLFTLALCINHSISKAVQTVPHHPRCHPFSVLFFRSYMVCSLFVTAHARVSFGILYTTWMYVCTYLGRYVWIKRCVFFCFFLFRVYYCDIDRHMYNYRIIIVDLDNDGWRKVGHF